MIRNIVFVVSKADVIKYMLTRPIVTRRIGKWAVALAKFSLKYLPLRAVKGHGIAKFLIDHPSIEVPELEELELNVFNLERDPWVLKFDSLSTEDTVRVGVVIISLAGIKTTLAFNLNFPCTNN